jgi:hypothetical protein
MGVREKEAAGRRRVTDVLTILTLGFLFGFGAVEYFEVSWPLKDVARSRGFFEVTHTIETECLPGIARWSKLINSLIFVVFSVCFCVARNSISLRMIRVAITALTPAVVLLNAMNMYDGCYDKDTSAFTDDSRCSRSVYRTFRHLFWFIAIFLAVATNALNRRSRT